jgi:2-octaprenylphenol hydroxylase
MNHSQVTVVGGGIVGLTLAIGLSQANIQVTLVDKATSDRKLSEKAELRVSAINLASRNILNAIGVWQKLDMQRICPYQSMSVWDADSFSRIQFDHSMVHQEQLGFIVENQNILRQLWLRAQQIPNLKIVAPAQIKKLVTGHSETFVELEDGKMFTSQLVVGADGAESCVRKLAKMPQTFWHYQHQSIVANVETEFQHENCARQAFWPSGPIAFLPLWKPNQSSIVWSQQDEQASALMDLSDIEFGKALRVALDNRLGDVKLLSNPVVFPLKMRFARQWLKDRVILIGDAAHTIHPLAGQGANLGLLDAAALIETLVSSYKWHHDVADQKALRSFERWRKADAVKMIAAMQGFKNLFDGDHKVKKWIRGLGMSIANNFSNLKNPMMKQALGLSGHLPEMAKQKLSR